MTPSPRCWRSWRPFAYGASLQVRRRYTLPHLHMRFRERVSALQAKMIRHGLTASSSLAPWSGPGRIAPLPSVRSPRPMGRCGCAAMSAGATRLKLAGLQDTDFRSKTFSCSRCGGEAYFCVVEPITKRGMEDYRLDEIEKPARHPEAVRRLTAPPLRPNIKPGRGTARPQDRGRRLSSDVNLPSPPNSTPLVAIDERTVKLATNRFAFTCLP